MTCTVQVRDSKVAFTKDAEKGMLVHLVGNPKKDKGGQGGSAADKAPADKERVQSMQSYSMLDWQDWRDYVEPADCLMQHRTGQAYAGETIPCLCCVERKETSTPVGVGYWRPWIDQWRPAPCVVYSKGLPAAQDGPSICR